MLATEMPIAETAVTNDSLGSFFAVLVRAADLLGWHTASERHCEVESRLSVDVVICEGTRRAEVLAGVDKAEIVFRKRSPHGEEGSEVTD
jgi:hypothetical protein